MIRRLKYYHLFLVRVLATTGHQLFVLFGVFHLLRTDHSPIETGIIGACLFIPNIAVSWLLATKLRNLQKIGAVFLSTQALYFVFLLPLAFGSIDNIYLWYFTAFAISSVRAMRSPMHYSLVRALFGKNRSSKIPVINNLSWQIPLIVAPLLLSVMEKFFSQQATVYLILGLLGLVVLLSMPLRKIQQKIDTGITETQNSWRALLEAKSVWMPAVLDAAIMIFVSLPIVLTLLLQGHGLPLEDYGSMVAILMISTVLSCLFLGPITLKWAQQKSLSLAFFGIAFGFALLAVSNDRATLITALILLGVFDGISIVVRDNILIRNSPTFLIGLLSAINALLLAVSDEFSQLITGATIQFADLKTTIYLSSALALLAGIHQAIEFFNTNERKTHVKATH